MALRESLYNLTHSSNFYVNLGQVVDVEDPNNLGRIKVRIKGPKNRGGDDDTVDSQLPWCFPLIPKHFTVQPKEGETVFILLFSQEREFSDRLYLGPIISQPQKLNFDETFFGGLAGFSFGVENPNTSTDSIPKLDGVFPKPEFVSVQGRFNTDIIQKDNEILIRAGKFENSSTSKTSYSFTFNKNTQSYIQLKNDFPIQTSNGFIRGTVTNVVANKINLITHADGSPRFNVTTQNENIDLITDEELKKILETAHQLPFGDVLLEYLILLKNAILFHVHNGNGNPATDLIATGKIQSVKSLKEKAEILESQMLSKNIRIN